MRYFKRFADFCTGFALFSAIIYLFREFMSNNFGEEELKITEKLKLFFDKSAELDNFMMLLLIGFFALSLAASCVFSKLPYISTLFSVPPLVLCMDMIKSERIEEYPLMYVILSSMGILGSVFESLRRDSEDGKCRAALGNALVSALTSSSCFFIYFKWQEVRHLIDNQPFDLNFFDYEIYSASRDMNMKSILIFACVYAGIAVLILVFGNVYFLSLPLTLTPCALLIYRWNAGSLTVHSEVIVTLSIITAGATLICTLSGKITPKKSKRKRMKNNEAEI